MRSQSAWRAYRDCSPVGSVQHNVPVIAIASNRRHRSSRTRVCKEILFADTGTEEFIQVLEMLGPKLNQKAVLFLVTMRASSSPRAFAKYLKKGTRSSCFPVKLSKSG